jgi:Flp pilus assembly protein TadG
LFLLLLAGIIEFGEAFRVEHALSNASRRGARACIVDGATTSQVRQKVKAHVAKTLGIAEGDVSVSIQVTAQGGQDGDDDDESEGSRHLEEGDEISVTVSVPFSKAGVGFYAKMFSNATMSSTCILGASPVGRS